jgi:hypothetical protein
MVTPENSFNSFFETGRAPWKLTSHGEAAARAFRRMRAHDRGNPHTPLLVVLDHLAGYNGYQALTWGVLPRTPADQEIADLLEVQLFKSPRRLPVPGNPANPEAGYLHPTRYGELCDVVLSTVTGALMKRYPVILLAGEVEFRPAFVDELQTALRAGSRLLLHPRHVEALGVKRWNQLKAAGSVETVDVWTHPETGRPAAVPDARLAQIARENQPIGVVGDPIQFQINRNRTGWVIELVNNDGVVKTGRTAARIYPEVIARVELQPRVPVHAAREWITEQQWNGSSPISISIPPGETRFVEFFDSPR